MNKKKELRRYCFAIIFIVLFLSFIIPLSSSSEEKEKISSEVIQELENNQEAEVFIEVQGFEEKKFFRTEIKNANEVKEDIKENLGESLGRDLGELISATINKEDAEELEKNPGIKEVTLVGIRKLFLQDSVSLINASLANSLQVNGINLTGRGQAICIIDTGVNYFHSSLGGCYGNNNASSSCKIVGGWDYVNDDSNPYDDEGHGTHVAGIVAANGSITGIASESKIIAMKACDSAGDCSDADIIPSIQWCVNNASIFNISVISMSFGAGAYTSYCNDDSLASYINSAVAKNISVVVATGNAGSYTAISSPACVQNATPIGAVTKSDAIIYNRNSLVMLLAPGTSITSTSITGGSESMSGTSMSTPHVAGAIAVLNQYLALTGRTNTTQEIEIMLNSTGKRIYDSSSLISFSRIDVYRAILNLDNVFPTFLNNHSYGSFKKYNNFTLNITFRDDLELAGAWVQSNHSGALANYTYSISGIEINLSKSFNITTGSKSFSYKWYFNDSAGNTNSTYLETFLIENTAPVNYTIGNLSWPINSNLTLNLSQYFYDIDRDELIFSNNSVSNVSIILNQTTGIVVLSPDLNFNGTSHVMFYANDSVNITSSNNVSVNVYKPSISYIGFGTSSSTTNFSNLTNFVNIPIIIEKENIGRINFSSVSLNLTDIDLDSYVNISDNKIEINSGVLSIFNTTAILTLYNITYTYPVIYRDGSICSSSVCQQIDYSNDTFIFNVSGFSYYETKAASCSDGVKNGDETETDCGGSCGSCTTPPGGGGSGGGSGSTITTFNPTAIELISGYTKSLGTGDKIKFYLNSENHTLTATGVFSAKVFVSIQSTLINLEILNNEEKKLNLTNSNYYDFYIKVNDIVDYKANLTIKVINEPVNKVEDENNESLNETQQANEEKEKGESFMDILNREKKIRNTIIIALIIALIAIAVISVFHFVHNLEKIPKSKKINKK